MCSQWYISDQKSQSEIECILLSGEIVWIILEKNISQNGITQNIKNTDQ